MEFEVFTPKRSGQVKRPALRINRKGLIWINAAAAANIGLKAGDTINFLREKKTQDWYLEKNASGAFTLRSNKNSDSLLFNNASLCEAVFNCLNFPNTVLKNIDERKALVIPLAGESVDGGRWALITTAVH
jgi:hypothetical protein